MSNIEDIAESIFINIPQDPQSIQIQFETDNRTVKDLFNLLFIFLKSGIRNLFNVEQVDIDNITDDHIFILNQYFNSFGYKVFFKIQIPDIDIINNIDIDEIDNVDDNILPDLYDNTSNHNNKSNEFSEMVSGEILTKRYDKVESTINDKLSDFFINLKSKVNDNEYKLYFDFY
jgi:hypothetical protein